MGQHLEEAKYDYHRHIPDKGEPYPCFHPKCIKQSRTNYFADRMPPDSIEVTNIRKYSEARMNGPRFQPIWKTWKANLEVPFYGVTSDGVKQEGLYHLQDEGAPTREMVQAARNVINSLNENENKSVLQDLDSEGWRKWSNPELLLFECGVRLENLEKPKIDLILELLKQSFSTSGYDKVRGAMKLNKFLGDICGRENLLNEYSYSFTLFGEPSETKPWGYMFFGHHLCINVFVVKQQMVIGPVFVGAEPCIIDQGPDSGIEICEDEGRLGLQLMRSLTPQLQKRAQIYPTVQDPAMPEGRWNTADQRHLAGAFQDNRVIPYEGILAAHMTKEQQELLMSIMSAFLTLYPPKPLESRLEQIRQYLPETYWSWIGGYGPADAFYYRIQSPVALFEFDHHSGLFLTNKEPAKYHIHTVQRLPNGNDYGRELRKLAREQD